MGERRGMSVQADDTCFVKTFYLQLKYIRLLESLLVSILSVPTWRRKAWFSQRLLGNWFQLTFSVYYYYYLWLPESDEPDCLSYSIKRHFLSVTHMWSWKSDFFMLLTTLMSACHSFNLTSRMVSQQSHMCFSLSHNTDFPQDSYFYYNLIVSYDGDIMHALFICQVRHQRKSQYRHLYWHHLILKKNCIHHYQESTTTFYILIISRFGSPFTSLYVL
jgi:hypothetical protein